ncbi:MAG: hypothetical protein HYV63_30935 [Candidatus Schekmanbacteria bacterium]|nr:hypothetical protein [Candidatus Schekmanbacteria bacterium]
MFILRSVRGLPSRVCRGAAVAAALIAGFALWFHFHDPNEQAAPTSEEVAERLAQVVVPFIDNEGQVDERVAYYAQTFAGAVFVTHEGELVYALPPRPERGEELQGGVAHAAMGAGEPEAASGSGWAIVERFAGGTPSPAGGEVSPTNLSFFIGNDPDRWRPEVKTRRAVELGEVWKGIDVELVARGKNVEKIFRVAKGAQPDRIRLEMEGASLRAGDDGTLVATTGNGDLAFTRPVAYQERESGRAPVTVAYRLDGQVYGFEIGDGYDPDYPLVIDPLLHYSYRGGNRYDLATDIAITGTDVYVVGKSYYENPGDQFPGTTGGAQPSNAGQYDAVALRLDLTLGTLYQATYLGGGGSEDGVGVALLTNKVFVSGVTNSGNFPTSGGYQATWQGGYDAFVARLSSDLKTLEKSSYFGTAGDETTARVAAIDSDVYLVGTTTSSALPGVSGSADSSFEGASDGFAARFNTDLSSLVRATYVGGNNDDSVRAVRVSASGVFVAGDTNATSWPWVSGAAQSSPGGSLDAFLARLDRDLISGARATYFGGPAGEYGWDLALGGSGVYLCGVTAGSGVPGTSGGAQPTFAGVRDVIVALFSLDLLSRTNATYLGGTGNDGDSDAGCALGNGALYVAGFTESASFPGTTGSAVDTMQGGGDAYVARLDPALTTLQQTTYLGGTFSWSDSARQVTVGPDGSVFMVGAQWIDSNNSDLLLGRFSSGLCNSTPPAAGAVNDGAGADIDIQTSTTSIVANWNSFTDDGCGIGSYEWAIGTTAGGTEVQGFTNVGLTTSGSNGSLSLSSGTTYYVSVRAVDEDSLPSTPVSSDGVLVDASPPTGGAVNDGADADLDFQSSISTINANWSGFSDVGSGIGSYEWAIGTSPGGIDVQGFTNVGASTGATNGSLSLANGTLCYVSVRGIDVAGNTGTAAVSDGVRVDTTGPTAGTVADGSGADVDYQASTTTIQANWSGFNDPLSGIASYEWAIGTTSGGTEVQGWVNVGDVTSTNRTDLTLSEGTTYWVSIRAVDAVGNVGDVASTDGVTVDGTPPAAGTVRDGGGADIDFQVSVDTIVANWTGFSDGGTGIADYEWAIGTSSGGTEVQGWTSVGDVLSGTSSSLTLFDGTTYYVSVRAIDGAGNTGDVATSDGVTVDTAGPGAGAVDDGAGADVDYQLSTTTIAASWSGFNDGGSGIASYEWAIGTTSGGTEVQGWTSAGLSTSASNAGLTLAHATTYFVSVRATDAVGNSGAPATSDGVTVDTTPPAAGSAGDGPVSDIAFQTSLTTISANWWGFADATSGIASYEWAIGSTPGGQEIMAWASAGFTQTATQSGLSLAHLGTYYTAVRAVNGVGSVGSAALSDGVQVDTAGPDPTTINDGPAADIDYQSSTTTLSTNWSAFPDQGSGVAYYEWAIGTTDGGTEVQAFTNIGLSTSATQSGLSLSDGTTYYVTVRGHDNLDNVRAAAVSDGVTVDTDGPAAGVVSDGTAADIDVQGSTASLSANWSGFTDGVSGIASYEWAIGTSPGGTDVQTWTGVGTATVATNGGLSLNPATSYYVSARALDNAGNTGSAATSDGVTPDTALGSAGSIDDGAGSDVDFQTSLDTMAANWSGFTPPVGRAIASYEWAIGTTRGGVELQGWTNVGLVTNATNSSLSLSEGTAYYVSVRAVDDLATPGPAGTSDGVAADATPPAAGTVSDGTDADIDAQSSKTTLATNWAGFSDGGSGVASYEWAIGSTPGGSEVQGFTGVGVATSASTTGLSLADGTYYVSVRATDNLGQVGSAAVSDGVMVDATAPTAGSVDDGAGADIDFQVSTTTISANWSGFGDGETGLRSYEWAIGATAGGTEIQSWTGVGMAVSATNPSLSLAEGTYYVAVRALDNVSNASTPAVSDGITVDTAGPSPGTVADGAGADGDFQQSTTTISANWSGFSDAASGIASYEWAVGTTPGGSDVQAWTDVGLAVSASNSGLTLPEAPYYVSVRATDNVGNAGTAAVSDGVRVDSSGPAAGSVADGTGADVDFQQSSTTISANWTGFADAASGVASYEWAIGTTPGGTEVRGWTGAGSDVSATASGLALAEVDHYVSVRATDNVGNTGPAAISDGVRVDVTPPAGGAVSDGAGAELTWQTDTTTISATWSGFADAASGVASYEWAIGTTPGGTEVQSWANVGDVLAATNASLALADATTYYVSLRAIDGVGNVGSPKSSDGVTVDATSPAAGTVNDGDGADIDYRTSLTTLSANWSGFAEGGSGIAAYEWAIGTSPGGTEVQAWTNVALLTSVTNAALALQAGGSYYVSVRASDVAGNVGSVATSDGVTVDLAAPTGGTVLDGAGADVDYQGSSTVINANWSGFADALSGIASYDWAIGTSLGGTQIRAWTSAGNVTAATASGLSLASGRTYWVSVRAVDAMGNVGSPASSDGVIVDLVAPTAGTVLDGAGADVDYQGSGTVIVANWSGFADALSGIASYDWAIGTSLGGTQIRAWTSAGNVTAATASGLSLASGSTYWVSVRAVDAVGNVGNPVSSDGVMADLVAPTGGTVRDGTGADVDYQGSATVIDANWSGFSDALSGIASYDWAIGTSPGGTQVRGWTSAGNVTAATTGGLTLALGSTYWVSVRAVDAVGNVGGAASSDGVTVDGTPPTAGTVNDGSSTDIDFQASATTIAANWSGFADVGVGVAAYDWAIGTTAGGTQLQGWTRVGNVSSATRSGLTLADGMTIYVAVRGVDGAGNVGAAATTDGVTIDLTGPTAGSVNDGTGADVDFQTATTTIWANWSGFASAGSGLAGYQWAIGRTAGGTELQGWTSLGNVSSATNAALALAAGTTYFVSVRGYDMLGNTGGIATSDGVAVDLTGPSPGTVWDGLGPVDIDMQGSATTISARWSGFTADGAQLAYYEWMIATQSGTMVQDWTRVDGTEASNSALSLQHLVSYYVGVRAVDAIGNRGDAAASDGVVIRLDGPQPGTVLDGNGAVDQDVQQSRTTISARWSGFTDASSTITAYEFSIGSALAATDVQGWTYVGVVTQATVGGLALHDGTTYYVGVRATNALGNLSDPAVSDGVMVDSVPPIAGTVSDGGGGADIDLLPTKETPLSAHWEGFRDVHSGLRPAYHVGLATTRSSASYLWGPVAVQATAMVAPVLALKKGETYYASVTVQDVAGNWSALAWSDGAKTDDSPPEMSGSVNDGTGADIDEQDHGTLSANWSGFHDNGVIAYYEVGTSEELARSPIPTVWQNVGMATSWTSSSQATSGLTHFVWVRATDAWGNVSEPVSSDGVVVLGALQIDDIVISAIRRWGSDDTVFMEKNVRFNGVLGTDQMITVRPGPKDFQTNDRLYADGVGLLRKRVEVTDRSARFTVDGTVLAAEEPMFVPVPAEIHPLLLGLNVDVSELDLEDNCVTVNGSFNIPLMYFASGGKAELELEDARLCPGKEVMFGGFSVSGEVVIPDEDGIFKLSELGWNGRTESLKIGGGFKVKEMWAGATVGIIEGRLDTVVLWLEDIEKPIGSTGVYLQSIEAGIEGLGYRPFSKTNLVILGGVGLTQGKKFLDDIALMSYDGELEIRLDGSATVQGTAKLLGIVQIGAAKLQVVWAPKAGAKAEGWVAWPGGFYTGTLVISYFPPELRARMRGDMKIPDFVPWVGGTSLASIEATADNERFRAELVIPAGIADVAFVMSVKWTFFKSANFADVSFGVNLRKPGWAPWRYRTLDVAQPAGLLPARYEQLWTVPPGVEQLLVRVGWSEASEATDFTLHTPTGGLISPDTDDPRIFYRRGTIDAWYRVVAPEAGPWSLALSNPTASEYVVELVVPNSPPTIHVTAPAVDVSAQSKVTIAYAATDADGDAQVSVYYGTGAEALDGTTIATGLPARDGKLEWDTSAVPPGQYRIYAVADDGENVPRVAYASGSVLVKPESILAAPAWVDATPSGNAVLLSWSAVPGAVGYRVYCQGMRSTERLEDVVPVIGETSVLLDTELTRGRRYRVAVAAYGGDLTSGLRSPQLVVELPVVSIDGTPPSTPRVYDNGDWLASGEPLLGVWRAEDPDSGVVGYQYCAGTSGGGCDVVPWTDTAQRTELMAGLSLSAGERYFIWARARNNAGVWSEIGGSNGIRVFDGVAVSANQGTQYRLIGAGGKPSVLLGINLRVSKAAPSSCLRSLRIALAGAARKTVSFAWLAYDRDGDGVLDEGDSYLARAIQDGAGNLLFDNVGLCELAPGTQTTLLVVVRVRASTAIGATLQATVPDDSAVVIQAMGGSSLRVLGAPVEGPELAVIGGDPDVPLESSLALLVAALLGVGTALLRARRARRRYGV